MDLGFGPCFYPAGDKKSLLPGEKPGETPFFPVNIEWMITVMKRKNKGY